MARSTISGRTATICAACGARPPWPTTAATSPTGPRFSTSTPWARRKARAGSSRASTACGPTSVCAWSSLSDGGEDAVEVREFDLDTGTFVAGGFHLPRGKHRVAWEDANHLLVASEWTPGDLTPSGYPYIVKRLTRGQPLSSAVEVYRGQKTDGGYGVSPEVLMDGQGRQLADIERPLDTFRHETWVLTRSGFRAPGHSGQGQHRRTGRRSRDRAAGRGLDRGRRHFHPRVPGPAGPRRGEGRSGEPAAQARSGRQDRANPWARSPRPETSCSWPPWTMSAAAPGYSPPRPMAAGPASSWTCPTT